MKKDLFLWSGKRLRGHLAGCFALFATLLAGAQAHAQQGPVGPFYDKLGSLEPMLGPVEEPCKGPRLIAASDPFSFLYRKSEGSSTRAEFRLRGSLGLCMRHFVAGVYGQYSDVKRGETLVSGYGPDGSEQGPWWESRDLYTAAQVGVRAILPSRGTLFRHEFLFLARGQVQEERDFKIGCEAGQCPWFVSGMPLYRLALGVLRLNAGASLDYSQSVTDWFERNPSHEEEGFGSRRLSFSGLGRLGVRLGKEGSGVLDLFAEAALTAPLMQDAGQPGRVYRVGAELGVPLIKEDGFTISLKAKADWAQHYVSDADCNAPERAGAPCYFKGFSIGPVLVGAFNFPLEESERKPAETEAARIEPKSEPASAPKAAPEPQKVATPAPAPVLPPVVTPPPAPAPAPVCTGVFVKENGEEVISTIGNDACDFKGNFRREPEHPKDEPLAVIACRSTGIKQIRNSNTGKSTSCEDILAKWVDRRP